MELDKSTDPIEYFKNWLAEAAEKEINDPNAMALATVGADGMPSVRMVLLKNVEQGQFTFFTNLESRKGQELVQTPKAALCFHWKSVLRQVRVEGEVAPLPRAEVEAYFNTRHPHSRLGAWASAQSRVLGSRAELEERFENYREKYGESDIPCPPYWGGFCLKPARIEFWQQGDHRLHDRFVFTRTDAGWQVDRLNP